MAVSHLLDHMAMSARRHTTARDTLLPHCRCKRDLRGLPRVVEIISALRSRMVLLLEDNFSRLRERGSCYGRELCLCAQEAEDAHAQ